MFKFLRRVTPAAFMALAGMTLLHYIDKPTAIEYLPVTDPTSIPVEQNPTPSTQPSTQPNPSTQPTLKPTSPSKPTPTKSKKPTIKPTPSNPVIKPTPVVEPTPANNLINKTVVGDSINNPYGATQVKVVIKDSKIDDIIVLSAPAGRSAQYTNFSVPKLKAAVIKAQSANVSLVSGATYTSDAYLRSVQSALDKI